MGRDNLGTSKISVKDIVEDCGINRNSFYYHYQDVPALIREIITDEAAALIAKSVKKYEVLAYPELGPEALARLTVEDFPAIVVIDCEGNNLYDVNQEKYRTLKGY